MATQRVWAACSSENGNGYYCSCNTSHKHKSDRSIIIISLILSMFARQRQDDFTLTPEVLVIFFVVVCLVSNLISYGHICLQEVCFQFTELH